MSSENGSWEVLLFGSNGSTSENADSQSSAFSAQIGSGSFEGTESSQNNIKEPKPYAYNNKERILLGLILPAFVSYDLDYVEYFTKTRGYSYNNNKTDNAGEHFSAQLKIIQAKAQAARYAFWLTAIGYSVLSVLSVLTHSSQLAGFSNAIGSGRLNTICGNVEVQVALGAALMLGLATAASIIARTMAQGAYSAKYMPELEKAYTTTKALQSELSSAAPEVNALDHTRWFFKGLWQGLTNQHPNFKVTPTNNLSPANDSKPKRNSP